MEMFLIRRIAVQVSLIALYCLLRATISKQYFFRNWAVLWSIHSATTRYFGEVDFVVATRQLLIELGRHVDSVKNKLLISHEKISNGMKTPFVILIFTKVCENNLRSYGSCLSLILHSGWSQHTITHCSKPTSWSCYTLLRDVGRCYHRHSVNFN